MSANEESDWRERALAAERTVVVLKDKVWALYNGGSQSTIQKQLDRSQRRQDEARRRRELIAVRADELARYSRGLEEQVKERTSEIRTILDHVTSGFLIIGPDLRVRSGFTRSCHALLSAEEIAATYLPKLFYSESPRDAEHLAMLLEQVFADMLPEELSLDFIPRRVAVGDRLIGVETRAIRVEGTVSGLLMTINDVTSLEQARRKVMANEVLIGILTQRSAFHAFVIDARGLLVASREAALAQDEAFVRRALHTVKGNAAAFGLSEVVSTIHAVESSDVIGVEGVARAEAAVREFLAADASVLGLAYDSEDGDESFEVNGATLEALRAVATDPEGVERWLSRLGLKRVDQVTGPLGQYVERLGERLEKEVAFVLHGGEVMIDARLVRPIFQNLTHVLRNAIDHGIEAAEDRGDKPSRGTVEIAVEDAGCEWRIAIQDDGRGIDPEQIGAAAIGKGLIEVHAVAGMNAAEKLALVFLDGLSTREVATDLSGRGVGMSALKAVVEQLGGTLSLESQLASGTRLEIVIPKASAAARLLAA